MSLNNKIQIIILYIQYINKTLGLQKEMGSAHNRQSNEYLYNGHRQNLKTNTNI